MTTILHIDTSARYEGSTTRDLSARIVNKLGAGRIIRRDLASPLPHVTEDWVNANFTPEDQRSDAQRETLSLSDQLVDELNQADTIVIGVPIYNFSAPASFKASKSCGGMTPPTTIMMSPRPSASSAAFNAGTSVKCPAARDDTPTTCTSFSTA